MSLGADWTAAQWPELLSERVPFSKIFNRAFMIAGIMLFILFRRILVPPEIKHLLTPGWHIAWRNFLTGWGLALVSMVLLGAVMAATDVFAPYVRLSRGEMLGRLAGALFAGVFVGFFEELFFRGILFFGLREHGHELSAYFLANLFYSVLHFVKPGERYFLEGLDVFAGFRHLLTTFDPFLRPLELMPGIIGLFLIGVVFSYALARTGNLYLSIGLHAGWIFSLKSFRVFGNFNRQDLGWAFGSTDPKIVSGVVTWIGILLVAMAISHLTRRSPGASGQPPARRA